MLTHATGLQSKPGEADKERYWRSPSGMINPLSGLVLDWAACAWSKWQDAQTADTQNAGEGRTGGQTDWGLPLSHDRLRNHHLILSPLGSLGRQAEILTEADCNICAPDAVRPRRPAGVDQPRGRAVDLHLLGQHRRVLHVSSDAKPW